MIITLLTVLVVLVCSCGAEANESTKAEQSGASTPEEAFDRFVASIKKEDWDAAFAVMTPESRDYIVGSLTAIGHMGMLGAEGKTVTATHVDPAKVAPIIAQMKKLAPEKQQTVAPKLSALVEKRADFVKEMLSVFAKRKMENWINDLKRAEEATLQLVEINEDVAKAAFSIGNATEDTQFKKANGRWYLDYQSR